MNFGTATNIHFTLLTFTNALGQPLLCSIVLKSERGISEIPISWKLGIDVCKNVESGGTEYEMLKNNYGNEKAMCRGPTCLGKEIPCFIGAQRQALLQKCFPQCLN
jgi:hypothetical protein